MMKGLGTKYVPGVSIVRVDIPKNPEEKERKALHAQQIVPRQPPFVSI